MPIIPGGGTPVAGGGGGGIAPPAPVRRRRRPRPKPKPKPRPKVRRRRRRAEPVLAEPMVTSAAITAPEDADQMEAYQIPAFFSTGPGAAQQYRYSEAGGVGQEEQAPDEESP